MKIVVRAPNWIGDSILALPAIETLSENFPEAEIWICGLDWIKDIFLPQSYITGIVSLNKSSHPGGLFQNVRQLKKHHFEIGLLLTNSFSSALLFVLSKIPQRWGYERDLRGLLLTKKVQINPQSPAVHQAQYYTDLLSGLGLSVTPRPLALSLEPEVRQQARGLLVSLGITFQRPLIILNPGAFYGSAKRWPVSQFSELASMLQEKHQADILIVGSGNELDLAQAIKSQMKHPPLILSGQTTVSQLAGILLHANLIISNDSGPMHLANSLGIPVVAIFGPTDPQITRPFQQPSAVVKTEVDCWPCRHRECPIDHRCMKDISVPDVLRACERFLT